MFIAWQQIVTFPSQDFGPYNGRSAFHLSSYYAEVQSCLPILCQASANTGPRCTCRMDHPAPTTWACGHTTMELAAPTPYPCPTAQARNPVQLCPGFENVHKASSRNRMVNCRHCRDTKNPGPKRDGDNDAGASGPTSSLATQNKGVTVGA